MGALDKIHTDGRIRLEELASGERLSRHAEEIDARGVRATAQVGELADAPRLRALVQADGGGRRHIEAFGPT